MCDVRCEDETWSCIRCFKAKRQRIDFHFKLSENDSIDQHYVYVMTVLSLTFLMSIPVFRRSFLVVISSGDPTKQ